MATAVSSQPSKAGKVDAGSAEQDSLAPTWRQLPFYEAQAVRDASDFARAPAVFRSASSLVTAIEPVATVPALVSSSLASSSSNSGGEPGVSRAAPTGTPSYVLIGQSDGRISLCEGQNYKVLASWTAFHGTVAANGKGALTGRVTHLSCDSAGRLITLGEDEGARFPILRIWDLQSVVKDGNDKQAPRLLAETKVQHGSKPFPVASIARSPSSSFLAIGLGDGTVLLLRGMKETFEDEPKKAEPGSLGASPAFTLPKFKVIHQASTRPGEAGFMDTVTGLGFVEQDAKRTATNHNATQKQKGPAPRKPRNRITDAVYYEVDKPSANGQTRDRASSGSVELYIVTLSRILRYTVLGKGAGTPASAIDDVGCALDCAVVVPLDVIGNSGSPSSSSSETNKLAGRMIVARVEAIYVVGTEGREMSLAYEGKKSSIRLCSTQLVITSPPVTASAASASATVRHYVAGKDRRGANSARDSPKHTDEVAKLSIFDLESKLVAYTGTFEGGIRNAWADADGSVNVLSDDGELTRLDEKTLKQKLEILFRKSLYLLAIDVARSHANRTRRTLPADSTNNVDPLVGDIHRKYGDYLYERGDYEGAIGQFVKTIGVTQPSYVIRKFLDAQRINNLTTYLQELHACGLANADHTTLLLNCFAKLKDVASLDKFIKRPIEKRSSIGGEQGDDSHEVDDEYGYGADQDALPFDLDTAIRVCRQGGYFQHAAYLAQRYGQTDEYVRIQIEDLNDYGAATQYIRSLPIEDAQRNLVRYGRKMLDHDAIDTTNLLIELCSGAFQPIPIAVGSGVDATKVEGKANNYLSYLNVGRLGRSAQQAESQVNARSTAQNEIMPVSPAPAELAEQASPPSAQIFFAHFIDHQKQFVRFLETIALARWGQAIQEDAQVDEIPVVVDAYLENEDDDDTFDDEKREQKIVWNTLFELYLSLSRAAPAATLVNGSKTNGASGDEEYHSRAVRLLQQYESLPYDIGQTLIVCTQFNFVRGVVHLYERMGMYEDVLRLFMEREEKHEKLEEPTEAATYGSKILAALERYGKNDSELNALVLRHLVASEARLARHRADVERILKRVFEEELLSPLEVVQLLSKDGVATIGLVREHLMHALEAQQNDIAVNANLTRTYRDETKAKEAEIRALEDVDQPRIFQQSQCSACGGMLDLPSVHFMCKHSFHSRCLGEGENECPLCAQSHGVILEIRRNNLQFGQRHDLFINEVEEAEDGFDVVANMFSKGLLGAKQLGEHQQQ